MPGNDDQVGRATSYIQPASQSLPLEGVGDLETLLTELSDEELVEIVSARSPADVERGVRQSSLTGHVSNLSRREVKLWLRSLPIPKLTQRKEELGNLTFGFTANRDPIVRYAAKFASDELELRTSQLFSYGPGVAGQLDKAREQVGSWSSLSRDVGADGFTVDIPLEYQQLLGKPQMPFAYARCLDINASGTYDLAIIPARLVPEQTRLRLIEETKQDLVTSAGLLGMQKSGMIVLGQKPDA